MGQKKGIKKCFDRLLNDLRGVASSHGPKALFVYLFVKIILKIPLASSVFRKLCRGTLLIRTRILDNWMYLNLFDPGISHQLLVHGMREAGHVAQVRSGVAIGMRGLEIGANIGYYALLEGYLVGPSGHVYCIEPAPDNIALLRKNIAVNHFENRTSCFQCLVGEKNGTQKLFLSDAANSHSVSAISDRSVELPVVTIDGFLMDRGINPADIDFIRMDIEGYEVAVLQHMQTLLAGRTKPLKLFIELHPFAYEEWGWTAKRFIDYLTGLGFVPRSVAERIRDEWGHIKERAVDVSGREVSEVLARTIKRENESGFLDNWFFELPLRIP